MADSSPKYNKGITIYSNHSDNYLCHICPNEPNEPWQIHLLTQEHSSRYEYYHRYYHDTNLSFVTCKICDEWVDKSSIFSHSVHHKLLPWYRPNDELELLFKNFTSKHDNYYYCHLCELKISSWYHALYHANDFKHKKRQINELRHYFVHNLAFPSTIYDLMISNFIFPKTEEQLVCIICYENIEVFYTSILDHIDADSHKNAEIKFSESLLQRLKYNNNYDKRNSRKNSPMLLKNREKLEIIQEEFSEMNVEKLEEELIEMEKLDSPKRIDISEKVYFTQCKICNSSIFGGERSIMQHNKTKDHVKRKRQVLHKIDAKIPDDPVFKDESNCYLADNCCKEIDKNIIEIKEIYNINNNKREDIFYWCILCSSKFTNQRYVLQHIKTRLHLKELKKKPLNNEFEYFYCKICAKEFHKFTEFSEDDHCKTLDHLENDLNCLKHESKNNEEKEEENKEEGIGKNVEVVENKESLAEGIEFIHDNIYLCTMCNRLFNDEQSIFSHINTQNHIDNGPKVIFRVEDSKFFCNICKNIVESFMSLRQHLKSTRHRDNINEKFNNIQSISKNNENKSKCNELPEGIKKWRKRDFLCTICDRVIGGKVLINEHVNLKIHQEKFKEFNENNIYCKICDRNFSTNSLNTGEHEMSKEHRENLRCRRELSLKIESPGSSDQSSSSLDPEFRDSSRGKEVFFTKCLTCDCDVLGEQRSLSEHNHSALHAKKTRKLLRKHPLMTKGTDSETVKVTKKRYFMLSPQPKIDETIVTMWEVAKGLYNGEKIFWCNICHSRIPGDVHIRQHLDGSRHRTNLQKIKDNNKLSDKKILISTSESEVRVAEKNSNYLKSNHKQYNESEISLIEDLFSSEKLRDKNLVNRVEENSEIPSDKLNPEEKCDDKNSKKCESADLRGDNHEESSPKKLDENNSRIEKHQKETPIIPSNAVKIDGNAEIASFLSEVDEAIDRFSYANLASLHGDAEPPVPEPDATSSKTVSILETDTKKIQEKPPLPPPIYHHRNEVVESIECSICNVKIYGNYEIPVQTEYRNHITSKKHIENVEKYINTPRVVKLERPNMKYFKSTNHQSMFTETCAICRGKVKDTGGLHRHMTKHFWKRFVVDCFSFEEEASTTGNSEAKEASSVQLNSVEPEKKGKATCDSSEKKKSLEILKIKLDITNAKAGKQDIYKIDNEQLQNIKIGAILSVSVDKASIYCLVCGKNVKYCLQTFYEHLRSINHEINLKKIREDDELFREFPDQFSDLALACQYMEEISDSSVYCHACRILLQNNPKDLVKHIEDEAHIEKSSLLNKNTKTIYTGICSLIERNYYSTQRYWCVLCDSMFCTELLFREHLMRKYHLNKLNDYAKKREKLIMDYCSVCATLWFGFSQTYSFHSQQKMHKFHKNDRFFIIDKLPISVENFLINYKTQHNDYFNGIIENNSINVAMILENLEITIADTYPEVKIHGFGSRVTGICRENSDLNIFVDCQSQTKSFYNGENSTFQEIQIRLEQVKNCLDKNKEIWSIPEILLSSRIPKIKIKHKLTGIDCHLSFTNGLTTENTAVVRNYCVKHPDCRKLMIFINNWMDQCELSGSNGIKSYGVAWLVIYFLQVKKILPTIDELIKMNNASRLIGGWETGVVDDYRVIAGDNFDKLLNELFKFYANFDYRNYVMCPLIGKSLKKIDFQKPGKLPVELKNYVKYVNSMKDPQALGIDCLMCLQDPFELSQNITKAVNKLTVHKFRIFCKLSAEILDDS